MSDTVTIRLLPLAVSFAAVNADLACKLSSPPTEWNSPAAAVAAAGDAASAW